MGRTRKAAPKQKSGEKKKPVTKTAQQPAKDNTTPKISFNETFFRALIEHSSNAIALINSEGIVIYDSPAVSGILGYSPTEWIGKNVFELVHPDDLQEVQTLFANLVKTKAGQARQIFRVRHKDNHWVWLDVVATNLLAQTSVQAVVVNYRDVTQLKHAMESLKYSEERMQFIIEQSPFSIQIFSPDGLCVQANQAWEKLWGSRREQLVGYNILDDPKVKERGILPYIQKAFAGELIVIPPIYYDPAEIGQAGNARWTTGVIYPVKDAAGQIREVVLIHEDITERKQAEAERMRLLDVLEASLHEIYMFDPETLRFQYINQGAQQNLGYSAEKLYAMTPLDIKPEFTELAFKKLIEPLSRHEKETLIFQTVHRRADDSHYPVEVHLQLIERENKALYLAIINDITERKQSEAALNEANQRALIEYERLLERLNTLAHMMGTARDIPTVFRSLLQFLIASAPCSGLFVSRYDAQRQERTCIYAWSEGEEYDPSTLPVMPMTDSPHSRAVATDEIIVTGNLTEILKTQPHVNLGLEHDQRLPVSSIAVPMSVRRHVIGGFEVQSTQPDAYHTEHIAAMRMAATLAAISMENVQLLNHLQGLNLELEQRVTERTAELNKTNIELEHANRAKDEFLANMSHELRTPLNSILGLSESMLEQYRNTFSEKQKKSLQIIESSGRHLLDLINDILDLSKIEAGKFDYYPQSINVNDLCNSSLIFVKMQAMKKGITLTYEIEDTVADFSADPRRLKQILVNLLTNAVKFTPNNGHVTLKVNLTQGVIQFSVIDTGIGIAPEDLQRLFTPFVQVESSLNRHFEGTGLGLALVHKLTDMHGGSIEVESEVGKGSRFTIKLPYQGNVSGQTNEAEKSVSHPVDGEANFQPKIKRNNQKILLVEDNPTNILTMGEYFESHGYEMVIATDGVQAIEKANETNPDIILMDIQIPILDGAEATRRLRADVRFAKTLIIALTALAMPGDRERCLEAGANEYMSKPVSLKELRKVIENFLDSPK